ncbi:MAG TPA: TraB/GumN family protein, partial [archaeon]|nr:TraB/GumN family protein [archaeon]
ENELIRVAMEEFQKQFPYLYKILVEERNQHMAQAIQKIQDKHEKIVVVVGAGHEKGIKTLLNNIHYGSYS